MLFVTDESPGSIGGIASDSSSVYVVRHEVDHVEVRDRETFDVTKKINVPGLTYARGVAACQRHNCLYVSDYDKKLIHRVDLDSKAITKWAVNGEPLGLSITRNHNLIITLFKTNTIAEYTTQGDLVREIKLDDSIDLLQCCVELSTGQFVVSHDGSAQHRVLIIDTNGRIVKSYGGPSGSSPGQLIDPYRLTVDTYDNVLVADCRNNKVQVSSAALTHLYDVTLPKIGRAHV